MQEQSPLHDLEKCFEDFNSSLSGLEKAYDQVSRKIDEYRLNAIVPREYLKEMAGNLAHEIRNPLASIATRVELLSYESDDSQTKNIQNILDGVRRIDKIVENLVVFSQPVLLHHVQCNFGDLLKRAIGTLKLQLGEHCGKFKFMLELPVAEIYAEVDPVLLIQAVQNILLNAVENMPDGGQIKLVMNQDTGKKELNVTIEDNGPGLKEADLEKPFYPFYTTKTYGMGLGLPTSRLILEKHDGAIKLQKCKNVGLEVLITLPIS